MRCVPALLAGPLAVRGRHLAARTEFVALALLVDASIEIQLFIFIPPLSLTSRIIGNNPLATR